MGALNPPNDWHLAQANFCRKRPTQIPCNFIYTYERTYWRRSPPDDRHLPQADFCRKRPTQIPQRRDKSFWYRLIHMIIVNPPSPRDSSHGSSTAGCSAECIPSWINIVLYFYFRKRIRSAIVLTKKIRSARLGNSFRERGCIFIAFPWLVIKFRSSFHILKGKIHDQW